MSTLRKLVVVVLATCMTLVAGCTGTTWTVRGSYNDGPWKIEGEISGTTEEKQQIMRVLGATSLDSRDFSLDVSGTTLAMPTYGTFTLKLISEDSDIPRATRQFTWTRNGATISAANPTAVNSWLNQYGLPSDRLSYELAPLPDTAQPGWNTISVASMYDGSPTAASSQTFYVSPRGSGCGPVGVECDPK